MESISDFITVVRRHAARLSRSTELDPRAVQREIEAIPAPEVTTALLKHACGSGADEAPPEPHERLLQALLLRRAIEGTEHELNWRAPLTYEAAAALQQLRSIIALYPLRLELLDELIAHGGPPQLLAEWYYARGNTHCGLAGTPASPAATEDFRRALVHAVDARDGDMLAFATLGFGKSVAALPDEVALEYADQARTFVDAALAYGFTGFNRAMVLQAHAHLLRKTDPGGAAEALAEAVELVPRDNPFRVELAAGHVSLTRIAGRIDEATELGRRYLEQAVDIPQDVNLGLLHLAYSHALNAPGRPEEARSHAHEALVCFRGRDLLNELRARIQLAIIALDTGQWDALDEQLRLIEAHTSSLTPEQRLDVTRIEAAAAKERGRLEQHRESVERAAELSYNDEERVRTRLERAQLALADGRSPVDDVNVLLVDAVAHHAASQSIMGLVASIVCNSPTHPLGKPTLDRVAAWAASHQRFTVLACIQHRGGDIEGARETLRRALELPLSDHERLGCIHLLVRLLEDDDSVARERLHPEFERLLELDDVPSLRIDLATSLQRDATRERDRLQRAWYHAHRAWQGMHTERSLLPQEQAMLAHTCETAARILLRLVQSRLPESSPAIAELIAWIETDLPFADRGEFRLMAARMLLHPGPVCHPAAVARARRIVSLAKRDLGDAEGIEAVSRRLDWISTYLDEGTPASGPADGVEKPFDAAPRWLVDAIAGRPYEVDPRDLVEHLELLHQALLARLDVADRVLARSLPLGDAMAPPDRARLHEFAFAVVQRLQWGGTGARPWAALQRVASTMAAADDSLGMQTLVAIIARARGDKPPPTSDTAPSDEAMEDPERIRAWFERAIALMQQTNDSATETARLHIGEARSLLARAVRVARRQARPELFGCLVSLGNAWKTSPDADLDQALTSYSQAAELPLESDQEGQLCKVKGDALLQRGAPGDLREAETLLERAVQLRSGRFKAEALASLAEARKRHPDLSQELQFQRAAETLMEAARVDGQLGAQLLPRLLEMLDRWKEHAPTDPRPSALRGELARMFPERVEDIGRTQEQFSEADVELMLRTMEHPAKSALDQTTVRLQTPEELDAGLRRLGGRLAPEQIREFLQQRSRESLLGDPDGLRAELARLERASDGDQAKRPGVLSARPLVLAELARLGQSTARAVRRATDEAMAALPAVDDPKVRSIIITHLARIWLPTDHAHDPVRDFGYAAELLREDIVLQGGEKHALLDSIEFLAHAHRYCPTGDRAANLRESRRLYRLLLDRARQNGHHDLAANTLHCLTELENYLGEGDRMERMKRCDQLYCEAIALTPSPVKRAEYTANLALMRTQAAGRMDGSARADALRRALETFDQVDRSSLPQSLGPFYASNRVLCETMIARDRGDRGAALRAWRRHLEALGPEAPVLRASAQHNLALVLIGDEHVTPDELREALRLLELAAVTRREEPDVRHRWETMLDIGRAIVRAMDPSDPLPADGLPWATPAEAWDQARRSLTEAASAAEALGPGSELAEAGHWLARLVGSAASTELALGVADQAWTVLDAATPHLVTSIDSREGEARVSYHVALGLAHRLASSNPNAEAGPVRWALEGDQATPALRWMLRAQQVTRRAVRARLARPRGVSDAAWSAWQAALRGDDPVHRAEVLRRLRQEAPWFLSYDPDLPQMWRWLDARPNALVVATMGSLALAAWVDEGACRRLTLLGLSNEPPPGDPHRLAKAMNDAIRHGPTILPYAELAAWAHRVVVEPLTGFIGRSPGTVLWIPDPRLRHVPPGAIWGCVPVATAISADLLDPHVHPGRHPSTLVGLADPGDLNQRGLHACRTLAEEATRSHPARVLASQGRLHGKALIEGPNVRDTPASVRDLLAESQEHRTIVLIAHGAVDADDPMRAYLVCVDAHGEPEYLGVQELAAHPEAFAGAQVILLSCNSGLMGHCLTEPGGLAGTLISAGARWVVAPLWPITVPTAQEMGCLLLRGLAEGNDPWELLATVASEEAKRPTNPTTAVQRASFVAWVG